MNFYSLLAQRASDHKPLRVVLISAVKFVSMFLSQVRCTTGMRRVAIADLSAQRARDAGIVNSLTYGDQPALICERVDWARAVTGRAGAGHRTCSQ